MARRKVLTRLEKVLRSDGALCMTFVNTERAERRSVASYEDLLAWGVEVGALALADSERLAAAAAEHPGQAGSVARRAKTLRDRLERILLALANRERPAASDFDPFNDELNRALSARRLAAVDGGYRWVWGETGGEDFDRMLWPVLLLAGELLASPEREQVRQCPDEECGLWFVARSGGAPQVVRRRLPQPGPPPRPTTTAGSSRRGERSRSVFDGSGKPDRRSPGGSGSRLPQTATTAGDPDPPRLGSRCTVES